MLLENEKNNFRLVNSAVSFLGGVPAMINPADMSNTIPNEKVRPDMEVFSSPSAAIHLSVFQEVKLVMDFTAPFFFSFFCLIKKNILKKCHKSLLRSVNLRHLSWESQI